MNNDVNIIDKLAEIGAIINQVQEVDPGVAGFLREGFGLSLNLIQEFAVTPRTKVDVTEHLEIVARVLGVSLEDLVNQALGMQSVSDKQPDADTLNFITSDLDDYEKFLAQNKAKDDLNFLASNI